MARLASELPQQPAGPRRQTRQRLGDRSWGHLLGVARGLSGSLKLPATKASPAFVGQQAQQLRAAPVRSTDPFDFVPELVLPAVGEERRANLAQEPDGLAVGAHVGLLEDTVEQATIDVDRLVGVSLAPRVASWRHNWIAQPPSTASAHAASTSHSSSWTRTTSLRSRLRYRLADLPSSAG